MQRKDKRHSCPVPSCPVTDKNFRSIYSAVLEQIEFDILSASPDKSFYNELALIMTEVYMLSPDSEMRCAGTILSVGMVQQVYKELTKEHLELVADNFHTLTFSVRHKKAYLRTALYNSVFEFESHWINEVSRNAAGGGK